MTEEYKGKLTLADRLDGKPLDYVNIYMGAAYIWDRMSATPKSLERQKAMDIQDSIMTEALDCILKSDVVDRDLDRLHKNIAARRSSLNRREQKIAMFLTIPLVQRRNFNPIALKK